MIIEKEIKVGNTYTYEEVFTKSLEYFNGDDLATEVWMNKYCLKNNDGFSELTPDDMHRRMAKEFAKVELFYRENTNVNGNFRDLSSYGQSREFLTEDKIFTFFEKFKYIIPQGSVMSVLGNNKIVASLSNCIVLDEPYDSYGGIMYVDQQLTQLYKRRCGVGVSLSSLRPKDSPVSNSAGSTSGAVSFMERFSNTTREVGQAGRRGALMLTMDVKHPDIRDFITIKQDLRKVTGANISVWLNDEFMQAVLDNSAYLLQYPVNVPITEAKIVVEIKAKELWDTIIECAHNTAEPGIIFGDRQHEYSTSSVYPNYKNVCVNPCCFSEDCRVDVITDKGIKDIRMITAKDKIFLENENKFVATTGYFKTGLQKVYNVKFSNGDTLELTDNHKLAKVIEKRIGKKINRNNFELVELKDLKADDKIRIQTSESLSFGNNGEYDDGLILGWLSGDGCLSFQNENDNFPVMILDFWQNEHDLIVLYENIFKKIGLQNVVREFKNNGNDVKRLASSRLTQYFIEKFEQNIWKFKKGRNDFLYEASQDFIRGYLSAYFTADGTVNCNKENSSYSVSLSSIEEARLRQIQTILANFGIKSGIDLMRKGGTINDYSFDNAKDCFRLTITGISNLRKFAKYIGFLSKIKISKLNEIIDTEHYKENSLEYTKIISIEYSGEKETGCIEVPDYGYFTANGLVSGNSEISMGAMDSCRLMVVNYYSFVKNPFSDKAEFDYEKLYAVCYEAQRLMDDLVDLELESIERILEKIRHDKEPEYIKEVEARTWKDLYRTGKDGRRTGLGFTALADTIAALGFKFDSDEALEIIDKISRTKLAGEFDSSIDMALERGKFKDFNPEIENTSLFVGMLKANFEDIYSRMMKFGRRNISISTVAPTGSVSIMTQTSSGIEPVFQLSYKRRRKINPSDKKNKIDFVDNMGDAWQEYLVLHPKFRTWLDINELEMTDSIHKKSPYYKSTAEEIDWIKRVKIQSVVQKYTTHSISSTINLPTDVSVEKVGEIYVEAWKHGLKGITIYRDGCRSGVLLKDDEKLETFFNDNHAPKRPKFLPANVYRFQNGGEQWIAFIGILNGRPYEIFTGMAEGFEIPKTIEFGEIRKTKNESGVSNYDFIVGRNTEDIEVYKGLSKAFDREYHNYAKFISGVLRHGMPIPYVVDLVDKLSFNNENINSWKSGVLRALKKYIKDGVTSDKTCGNCGKDSLVYQEGCLICRDCGHSKC